MRRVLRAEAVRVAQTSAVDHDPQVTAGSSTQSPGKKANSCHLSSVPLLPACHLTLHPS